jgi:hypothetical protein
MLVQHLLEHYKALHTLIRLHILSVKKPLCIRFVHLAFHKYVQLNNEAKYVHSILY